MSSRIIHDANIRRIFKFIYAEERHRREDASRMIPVSQILHYN